MKPGNKLQSFDRLTSNTLIASAIVLVLALPFNGVMGVGYGPKWAAESRIQMASALALTLVVLCSGCSIRGGVLYKKCVWVTVACLLGIAFWMWAPSWLNLSACIVMAGMGFTSIYLQLNQPAEACSQPMPSALQSPSSSNGKVDRRVLADPEAETIVSVSKGIVQETGASGSVLIFDGTDIPVRTVLAGLANGKTTGDLLQEFPMLTEEHIHAAIAYSAASMIASPPAESARQGPRLH
ncbi:MAG: DUF433 domain-containing protein [Armatimonadetes bacterium]|nr:DUF433 domain-containing protein [Armatimonadota bacterium]